MPQFLILLRGQGAYEQLPPEQRRDVKQRYFDWTSRLRETGRFLGANKLTEQAGRVVRKGDTGLVVTDGPFVETKEILGGYYLINADSYEDAIDFTRDCPHYDFGSVEVREVEEMPRA